jgi:hypothetical protein
VAAQLLYSLTMELDVARQQWDDGRRRIEESRRVDRRRHDELLREVDVVVGELRGRVGQTFTLAELADAYDGADAWVRDLLEDADPEGDPVTEPGTVADAAFHQYSRGASDYRP